MPAAQLHVSGRVQGVSYRASTRESALALQLVGWVRNEADGGVTVWGQGPQENLDALIAWCKKGPQYASVKAVETVWVEETPGLSGFEIKR